MDKDRKLKLRDPMPEGYDQKFDSFLRMIAEAKEKVDVVVIHHPEVLGDNYEEMVESLNRIADAELQLVMVPRKDRAGAKEAQQ
jgi:Mrp family chromosome partitioning ATPase